GNDLAPDDVSEDVCLGVAALDTRGSHRRKIELTELMDEPWTMPELDNVVGRLIVEGFRSAGMALPAARIVSNSMAVRMRLVATGRLLTLLPSSIVHFGANRLPLKILPVALPLKSQPAQIITLKDRTPNAIAKLFVDELRVVTQPLRRGPGATANLSSKRKQAEIG